MSRQPFAPEDCVFYAEASSRLPAYVPNMQRRMRLEAELSTLLGKEKAR